MIEVSRILSDNERSLLTSLLDSRLDTIDAALAAPPDTAWHVVRLHTSKGAIDITCLPETLPINDEGDSEEFGVIGVSQVPDVPLKVPDISCDTTVFHIGRTITGAIIAGDRLRLYERGIEVYERTTSKAIVIETDGDAIAIDRQAWFEEMLTISQGPDSDALITDEWAEWTDDEEEDPGIHYAFSSMFERL